MRTKKAYHEVILIGKKRQNHRLKMLLLFFCIFCGIFLAVFFTIKSLFFIPKTPAVNFYAIYTEIEAKTYETAETKAVEFKARGGAGIVVKTSERFSVILSIYPDNESAKKVVQQLLAQNISAQIETIKLPTFSLSNATENEADIIINLHTKYIETLQNLYDLSFNLDTNQISQSYTLMRINELALLWEQRAEILANKIDTVSTTASEKTELPLYPIYRLSLYVASELKYLATENTYQDSLKTLISVIRQTNYMLCVLEK